MTGNINAKIRANPKFQQLVSMRNTYSIIMTILVMVAYFGYILLIAFDKSMLAAKIGAGVTSIGIPLGVGVIVFTIVVTWIYVRRANSEFDAKNAEIVAEASK